LRIIKNNTYKYDPFYCTLPIVKKSTIGNSNLRLLKEELSEGNNPIKLKVDDYFKLVSDLNMDINKNPDLNNILYSFAKALNCITNVKEYGLYFFDKNKTNLVPINENVQEHTTVLINSSFKEGILDWLFEEEKAIILPDFKNSNTLRPKFNYFIVPLTEKKNNIGVLSVLVKANVLKENSIEEEVIKTLLGLVTPRIENIKKKTELIETYKELQVYQSKLTNDFKLSAVGELTFGIAEEVLSSLQIILSNIDFLEKEPNADLDSIEDVKNQVQKIRNVISRLVKFSDVNDSKMQIHPCNVNEVITDFYNVIASSVKKDNYECMLDLEKELPPVLSHPNFINQILVNVYSVLKPVGRDGGMIIQTKDAKDQIIIKFFTTDNIKIPVSNLDNSNNMSLRILDKLMKKHEGEIKINSSDAAGTTVILIFPLRRRLRS